MADGQVVIGVVLDTAAFAAGASALQAQAASLAEKINLALGSSVSGSEVNTAISGLVNGITATLSTLSGSVSQIMGDAAAKGISTFTGAGWSSAGTGAMNALEAGIGSYSGRLNSTVAGLASGAAAAFSASSASWYGAGAAAMSGLAAGIASGASEVNGAVRSAAEQAYSTAKSYFKISSPSKLMRDEVGIMISRGISEGITDGGRYITDAVNAVGTLASASVGTHTESGQRASGVTQNIYLRDSEESPYASARRIRRESEAAARYE